MVRIKGTEKAGGYSQKTVTIYPGAVSAGANVALPTWAQGAWDLVVLIHFVGSDGTAAAVGYNRTKAAKGTASPSAGQACLYNENNLRLGDATTTKDLLVAVLEYPSFEKEI